MNKIFIVVSYDISNDKRLRRVSKEMKKWGIRVQKSVFECMITESSFIKMKLKIKKLINPEEDSIRFYLLCKNCVERIEYMGKSPPPLKIDKDFEII